MNKTVVSLPVQYVSAVIVSMQPCHHADPTQALHPEIAHVIIWLHFILYFIVDLLIKIREI